MTPSTLRRMIAALIISCAVALTAVLPSEAAVRLQSVAHRGDKQYHPDNSLAGIRSAVNKGADWVEIDVIYNPQGNTFFLSHDNGCSGPGGRATIDTDSAATVRARCALPELGSVLNSYKATGYLNFIVEFKATSKTTTPGATALATLLKRTGTNNAVYVSSLSDPALKVLRTQDQGLKLMRVRHNSGAIKVSRSYIDTTRAMGMQSINVNLWAWNAELVAYARSKGLVVCGWAWPTASENTNTEAINLVLDMWMTDRLDDLHQKLGR